MPELQKFNSYEGYSMIFRGSSLRNRQGRLGEIQELHLMVDELREQLKEAQSTLEASDEQLSKVSGECEGVQGEACVVQDLVGSLTGSGPSSLSSVFEGFLLAV